MTHLEKVQRTREAVEQAREMGFLNLLDTPCPSDMRGQALAALLRGTEKVFVFDDGLLDRGLAERKLAAPLRAEMVERTMRVDAGQPWDAAKQRRAELGRKADVTLRRVSGTRGEGWELVPNEALRALVA